jgi:hypothetical protein
MTPTEPTGTSPDDRQRNAGVPDARRADTIDCATLEAALGAVLDGDLDADAQDVVQRHLAACAACRALVADLDAIIADAKALPPIEPARELWHDIAARLETPVVPLDTAPGRAAVRRLPTRWLAAAAALLVTVSSAVTWQVARRGERATDRITDPTADGAVVAFDDPSATTAESTDLDVLLVAPPSLLPAGASPAAESDDETAEDLALRTLRAIVDERIGELDPATATVLRRNLALIDRALAESREALARDPRNPVLAGQRDRARERQLALLRRVAIL